MATTATSLLSNPDASWNPALRPDSEQHSPSSLSDSKPEAAPTASWNPAFRPNSEHHSSSSLFESKSSSSAPSYAAPSYAAPSHSAPATQPHSPPPYTSEPSHSEAADRDIRSQVPLLRDEKKDSKVPAGAVVESSDLEAGVVALSKDVGLVGRAKGGLGMVCYVVVLCLTLGMFGCYSFGA